MKLQLQLVGTLILALGFTACPTTTEPPTPTPNVAKVVLEQKSILLAGLSAQESLVASAFDANGAKVQTPITFSSSKPDVVSVDVQGNVKGLAVGSAQITASVGSTSSAPIIAAVAELVSDIANIASDKIVSGPSFENPDQATVVGSKYSVVVQNVTPTVGKKWFSQGNNAQRLEGKIVAVEALANNQSKVTLEVIPFQEVFSKLLIDEDVDVSKADSVVPPAAEYIPSAISVVRPQAFVSFGNSIECELSNVGGTPPISLNIPQMSIGLDVNEARTHILVRLGFFEPNTIEARFAATLNASMSLSGSLTRNFNGTVDCRTKNPISSTVTSIPLPLLTSLGEERGLGIKFSGSFSGPTTSFRVQGSTSIAFSVGAKIDLNNSTITPFNSITPTNSANLNFTNSGPTISRINLTASPYVYENWVFRAGPLAFDIWQNQNGLRLDADLATINDQLSDPNYASGYKLERFGRQGPGAEFAAFLNFFNAGALAPQTQSYSSLIDNNFTLESFGCGVSNFGVCVTRFSDKDFPVIGANNIDKLEIYRRRGTTNTLIATDTGVNVTNIVTTFPSDQIQAGDRCVVVAYTKLMPGIPLEAGTDADCLN